MKVCAGGLRLQAAAWVQVRAWGSVCTCAILASCDCKLRLTLVSCDCKLRLGYQARAWGSSLHARAMLQEGSGGHGVILLSLRALKMQGFALGSHSVCKNVSRSAWGSHFVCENASRSAWGSHFVWKMCTSANIAWFHVVWGAEGRLTGQKEVRFRVTFY